MTRGEEAVAALRANPRWAEAFDALKALYPGVAAGIETLCCAAFYIGQTAVLTEGVERWETTRV